MLTDPVTGCALAYGRERYRPPADLDELIRLTYAECTFPLSCESSATSDLDHTVAWSDGGHTELRNISPLCSRHHTVKHHTEWSVEQAPDGTITWTSPAGFEYIVEPTPLPQHVPRFEDGAAMRPPF
nr:HNH endonuclease signature motif containing protein [Subtercola boreus]